MPNLEFEFVEVDKDTNDIEIIPDEKVEELEENVASENEEFDFPLFASVASDEREDIKNKEGQDVKDNVARPQVMKVSLKEDYEEVIVNERPESYYFARFSEEQKTQFIAAAITAEDIYEQANVVIDLQPWKCIDLKKYNLKIENELLKKKLNRRPGKKKRENKIACRERKLERAKTYKKIEKEKMAKLKKKMFHKRGGKKHKKKEVAPAKPKYRTE